MLNVYFDERHVADLWLENKYYCFRYIGLDVPAISLSLPVREAAYLNDEAKPYFANLLPEGESRTAIELRLGVTRGDDYALLQHIGGDCAGAVTLFPYGEQPSATPEYEELSTSELIRLVRELPRQALYTDHSGKVRLSLPGVQHKTALYVENGTFYLPENGAPSSHILKVQITTLPGVTHTVENEIFTMSLARHSGLNVPDVKLQLIGDTPVFLTRRFDRQKSPDGKLHRILQEDVCQLMGLEPTMKYQNSGGPSLEDCANIIRAYSSDSLSDIEHLIRWTLFNIVVGNSDAHAKNIAILQYSGVIRLAPFYDLLSTLVYGTNLDSGLAMSIGREYDLKKINRGSISQFAEFLDVKPRLVQKVGRDMVERLTSSARGALEVYQQSYGENCVVQAIADLSIKRAETLDELLS
ncbi:MAG: type II toxin-antitoxin system HipA family toxin [Desulfuromonadaceae bacterium]|nr:type II toxin-antitoxin system HipA family toxin [Desulfuromonadaceae bacterium]MDD2856231.1 type II toxin-antitoxin system HipA family toxin [Desulfuromonadaceae bacterium]